MFSPCFVSATYSSSFPGSDASAPVTWTPRTSTGSGRGRIATWTLRRAVGRGLPGGSGSSLLALARERHPPGEREHDEQQEAGDGGATTTLSPAYRVPASAEALVRVQ